MSHSMEQCTSVPRSPIVAYGQPPMPVPILISHEPCPFVCRARGNVYQTMFNTLNVGIHAAEVELELGHPVEVLRQAELIDPARINSGERQAHYWTIRAAGYAMNRKNALAVRALLTADAIAPQHLRNRPLARELVRGLLERERRRSTPLRMLTSKMALQ